MHNCNMKFLISYNGNMSIITMSNHINKLLLPFLKFHFAAFILALLLCFVSCSSDTERDLPGTKTYIVFDNTRGSCPAIVYSDLSRNEASKLVEVPAGSRSAEIECRPSEWIHYYFSYTLNFKFISGVTLNYIPKAAGKGLREFRVEPGETNICSIPTLAETVSSPEELFSSDVYLYIQNNSYSTITLVEGSSLKTPLGASSGATGVLAKEKAVYKIAPGSASDYRILVDSGLPRLFPSVPSDFAAGRIYSYVYTDASDVQMALDLEMKAANVVDTVSSGGGRENAITLTENVWTDGNIAASAAGPREQWFKFTATAAQTYIHAGFGALTNFQAEFYAGSSASSSWYYVYSGSTGGTESITSFPVPFTIGQTYYVRVTPETAAQNGTYKIGYTASASPPFTFPPASVTPLTANVWENGSVSAGVAGGEQWFRFTATALQQYVHVGFDTLTNMYVQVYGSGLALAGGRASLSASDSRLSRVLAIGQTYYIRVMPETGQSGAYTLAFNDSPLPPGTAATVLTKDEPKNGIVGAGSEQWFRFTATTQAQFIHVEFETLLDIFIQVYDGSLGAVGEEENLTDIDAVTSFSRALIIGQTYYVRVRPGGSAGGAYAILFSETFLPTGAAAANLAENIWANGSASVHEAGWFRFTATAVTQYIHVDFAGASISVYVRVYDAGGNAIGDEANLTESGKRMARTLTAGQIYYIRVRLYSGSGAYTIKYNASAHPSGVTVAPLSENIWAAGSLTSGGAGGERWFSFTATAAAQYLHVEFTSIIALQVQVYNDNLVAAGQETTLAGSDVTLPCALTIGQTYFVRVRPPSGSGGSGTFRIKYNASILPSGAEINALAVNIWADGSISSGGEAWYSFSVTAGGTYYVWWNDSKQGNGKTLDIQARPVRTCRGNHFYG